MVILLVLAVYDDSNRGATGEAAFIEFAMATPKALALVAGRNTSEQIDVEILKSIEIILICFDRIPSVWDAHVVYVQTGVFRHKQHSG